MCTVSFVPIGAKQLFTSNRDETIMRGLASSPILLQRKNYQIACPVDPMAKGSWIAMSSFGDVVCLLNGAFKKHKRQLPYRKSRGLVVLDYFESQNPNTFAAQYDLDRIEPFTLVIIHNDGSPKLFELRWDGEKKYFRQLDETSFHLWSSITLYTDQIAEKKRKEFVSELNDLNKLTSVSLINLHHEFLYEEWVKPPLKVEEVSTLSTTCIEYSNQKLKMNYRDLVRKELPLAVMELDVKVNR